MKRLISRLFGAAFYCRVYGHETDAGSDIHWLAVRE